MSLSHRFGIQVHGGSDDSSSWLWSSPAARGTCPSVHATVTSVNDDDLQHYYSDYTLYTIKKQSGEQILI